MSNSIEKLSAGNELELTFSEDGTLVLSGNMLRLFRNLDQLFLEWASEVDAVEYAFPPTLPVRTLDQADYFSSFPHLATLTTRVDPTERGIESFVEATKERILTEVDSDHLSSAGHALPSAACYAVYDHFKDRQLDSDKYVTLASPCFRHEEHYSAGQRQWVFNMREVVCLGSADAVTGFMETYRGLVYEKLKAAGIDFSYEQATDPFFDKRDSRRIVQRLEPLKHEFLYCDELAIASINFHRTFFGERFNIIDQFGATAHTGCVAFGLERWLFMCLKEFGTDIANWPAELTPVSYGR